MKRLKCFLNKMIYLLFVLLCIIMFVAFYSGGRKYNSPWFVTTAMINMAVFVYCIYFDLMGKDISFKTLFVIGIGLISWGIGQNIAKCKCIGNKNANQIIIGKNVLYYDLAKKFIFFASIIIIVTVYLSGKYFLKIGEAFGAHDLLGSYGAARMYLYEVSMGAADIIEKPRYVTFLEMLSSSIFSYFLYIYLYNKIIIKHTSIRLLIPVICYLPIMFFSTSRMAFLCFILIFFALSTTFLYGTLKLKDANRKILRLLLVFFLIGALFFKIGQLVRSGDLNSEGLKSDDISEASVDLCMYTASSIYALNFYLESEQPFVFGNKTLGGIKQILSRFGFTFKHRDKHLKDVFYKTGGANVYTGFKDVIEDYSIVGFWIYLIIIGYICGWFFYRSYAYIYTPHPIFFVIYGNLYYPIFIYFYTDDFYTLTSVDFFVPLILLLLINKVVKKYYLKSLDIQ